MIEGDSRLFMPVRSFESGYSELVGLGFQGECLALSAPPSRPGESPSRGHVVSFPGVMLCATNSGRTSHER